MCMNNRKTLNGNLNAFNISSSLFSMVWLSKPKLRRTGSNTMCFLKKARNTNNCVLELKLLHAFSKLSYSYKPINCTYKNSKVKASVKVNPLPCLFLHLFIWNILTDEKNRESNCWKIKFSCLICSQLLY